MSRIGKQPVAVPAGVTVEVSGQRVTVKGPKGGPLPLDVHPKIKVAFDAKAKVINVSRSGEDRTDRALHGLTRALINNMVVGVTKGYEKRLKIEGVGYQGRIENKAVVLTVGFANNVVKVPPPGVTAQMPDANTIVITGADKQAVGQYAAEIRAVRKPEPYKGKGIRYENEVVRRKEGKSFTSGG